MILPGNIFEFAFSAQTVAPPLDGEIRVDAAVLADATKVYVANRASDGRDVAAVVSGIHEVLYLQDRVDHNIAKVFAVSMTVQYPEYTEFTVALANDLGAPFIDAQPLIFFPLLTKVAGLESPIFEGAPTAPLEVIRPDQIATVAYVQAAIADAMGGGGGTPTPPLPQLDLAVAKQHLRITDDAHDDDIERKLTYSEAVIVQYVRAGRSRWSDPNVGIVEGDLDPIVESAILDYLALIYEHRGDDYGVDEPDAEAWNAIKRKLERLRDPAVA